MGLRSGSPVAIILVLLVAGTLAPQVMFPGTGAGHKVPKTVQFASPTTLGYAGAGPTTLSLNWTENNDPSFFDYVLQRHSSVLNGWETVANLLYKTNTTFFLTGQEPNKSSLWQVTYQNSGGSQNSNPLNVSQPHLASLSYSQPTSTSAQLRWDNNAKYGGLLFFASYQLMESINAGTYFAVASYNNLNTLSYTVTGLSSSTNYAFYLNTTDQCIGIGCPSGPFSSSFTNAVTISTPGPLAASAHASPVTLDAGEPANFVCTGAGGAPPYAYSWNFGDGGSGTGSSPSHIYNTPGTMDAVCTVTDTFGTVASSEAMKLGVYIDPSITSFTATPVSPYIGQRITFAVSASEGNGSLTYSYARLPTGCSSTNSSSFSCTPTSSGTYDVTVTVIDQGQETANSTVRVSIGPSRVLGLPQAMGLAVIFGATLGIGAVAILSVVLAVRRKKGIPKQTIT